MGSGDEVGHGVVLPAGMELVVPPPASEDVELNLQRVSSSGTSPERAGAGPLVHGGPKRRAGSARKR